MSPAIFRQSLRSKVSSGVVLAGHIQDRHENGENSTCINKERSCIGHLSSCLYKRVFLYPITTGTPNFFVSRSFLFSQGSRGIHQSCSTRRNPKRDGGGNRYDEND